MTTNIIRRVGGRDRLLRMMEEFTIHEFSEVFGFGPSSITAVERKFRRRFLRQCKSCEKKMAYAFINRAGNCPKCSKTPKYSNYTKNESTRPLSLYGDHDYRKAAEKFKFASKAWSNNPAAKLRLRGTNWLA